VALAISERSVGDVTILDVPAQVMFYQGAALLRTRVNQLLDDGRRWFLLDLSQVTHLDSFGVGVIASRYVSVRGRGGDLKLLRPSDRSRHVLGTAGLMKIFESFDDEADAVRSFEVAASPTSPPA
jgi:anti-sigma B factor antagonist